MMKHRKGIGIINVVVAMGLFGALIVGVMKLTNNMALTSSNFQSTQDAQDLRVQIALILGNEKYCRISFAGENPSTSPITFKKLDIDDPNDLSEGLEMPLYLSNVQGTARTVEKFNSTNPSKKSFGKIDILSIKLYMDNNESPPINYPDGSNNDIGKVIVRVEKNLGPNKKREITLSFPLKLDFTTTSGVSRILSCSMASGPSNLTNVNLGHFSSQARLANLAIHSQTDVVPSCPSGWAPLWEGYSYAMGVRGKDMEAGVDLGGPGSCLQEFRPIPFAACWGAGHPHDRKCDFIEANKEWAYWLGIDPFNTGNLTGPSILPKIGRCKVCVAPTSIITQHSQTNIIPGCPAADWTKLWDGYSFTGFYGGDNPHQQDLSSPGSCLQKFFTLPFMECQNATCANNTGSDSSYWLSITTINEPVFSGADAEARIGRCSVCAKN